jgi:hypothetical protein
MAMISTSGSWAAAITEARPTAPVPKTARVLPGAGASTFHTVPKPVSTPQPSGASTVRSASSSTRTTLASSAKAYSAKEEWPKLDHNRWKQLIMVGVGSGSLSLIGEHDHEHVHHPPSVDHG